jgi:hypothetical protein
MYVCISTYLDEYVYGYVCMEGGMDVHTGTVLMPDLWDAQRKTEKYEATAGKLLQFH